MQDPDPKLPKFKLVERPPGKADPRGNLSSCKPEELASGSKPLNLSKDEAFSTADEALPQTEDMLASAYGAEKKRLRRQAAIRWLKRVAIRIVLILVIFAASLFYAHRIEEIPVLRPFSWYLPFLLSAALTAWFGIQSAKFWDQAYQLLAVFGIAFAGALIFWNIHVLGYAASEKQNRPSIRLSVPESVHDLYFTGEFDALRGIPKKKSAYARIPSDAYRRAFYAIPREEWRGHFQRYLSAAEMDTVNVTNIDAMMHEVARRIALARDKRLDRMEALIEESSLNFKIQQALLRPYTWLIEYL